MSLSSNAFLVYMITKVKPEAWDAIIPHGPKISVGTRDVVSSMVVKSIAKWLPVTIMMIDAVLHIRIIGRFHFHFLISEPVLLLPLPMK